MIEVSEIIRVKEKYEEGLLKIEGITGIGVNGSIRVYVEKLTPKLSAFIPRDLDGVPVRIVETGKIILLSAYAIPVASAVYADRKDRWRPVPGGVSCGHPEVTAGTLGCSAIDRRSMKFVGLSNDHVIALDWGTLHVGKKGDSILQPGPYDGGKDPEDKIGELERWIPVKTDEPNLIDAAIFSSDILSGDIYEVGRPDNTVDPKIGMRVVKSGRTSGVTYGVIIDVNASVVVSGWGDCVFKDQIVTDPILSPGDSGSWIGELDTYRSLALGFAGSPKISIHNKAKNVEKLLDLAIVPPLKALSLQQAVIPMGLIGAVGGIIHRLVS